MSTLKCIRIPTGASFPGIEPTDFITPDMIKAGEPKERGRSLYADQTGQLDVGVWECEPHKHVNDPSPYDEFVYLIEGLIEITEQDGSVETYKAGDSFVMPRGCTCTWDVKEPVRKLYVVLTADTNQG